MLNTLVFLSRFIASECRCLSISQPRTASGAPDSLSFCCMFTFFQFSFLSSLISTQNSLSYSLDFFILGLCFFPSKSFFKSVLQAVTFKYPRAFFSEPSGISGDNNYDLYFKQTLQVVLMCVSAGELLSQPLTPQFPYLIHQPFTMCLP